MLTLQHFDMENSADRQQVLADPDLFLRLHPKKLLLQSRFGPSERSFIFLLKSNNPQTANA